MSQDYVEDNGDGQMDTGDWANQGAGFNPEAPPTVDG